MEKNFELVEGFDKVENFVDDTIVEINLDEKIISVIKGQTLIAGECNSQYISFNVGRFYDGIDLSEKNIKVLYNGPTGYHSSDNAVNVMKSEDSIKFGWIVPRGAVLKTGELQIAVEFKNFDDEDYILKVQPTTMKVLDGMDEMEEDKPLEEAWYVELQTRCRAALTEAEAILNAIPVPQYGVCQDVASKATKLERVGSAAGLVAEIGVGEKTAINDFDSIYPWSNIKRCTISDDGTVIAYRGEPEYKQDGSNGQVVVEIPKFYRKLYIDDISGKEYRFICKEQLPGYELPRAFVDRQGNEIDKVYIGAFVSNYNEDNVAVSIEGNYGSNKNDYTITSQRHKARGINWHCIDMNDKALIEDLMLIEFATTDLESIFGGNYNNDAEIKIKADPSCYAESSNEIILLVDDYEDKMFYLGQELNIYVSSVDTSYQQEGIDIFDGEYYYAIRNITKLTIDELVTDNDTKKSKVTLEFSGSPLLIDSEVVVLGNNTRAGCADNVVASSGIKGDGRVGYVPFIWRGMENPFAYINTMIDGTFLKKSGYWVTEDISAYGRFNDPEATGADEFYEPLGIEIPAKTGYISKLGFDPKHPSFRLPKEIDGDSTSAYCDQFYRNSNMASYTYPLTWGGEDSLESGLWSYSFNYYARASISYNNFSGRLAYRRYE